MMTHKNHTTHDKTRSHVETSVDHPDELMTVPGIPHAEQPNEVHKTMPVPLPGSEIGDGKTEANTSLGTRPEGEIWEDEGGESGDAGESGEGESAA